MTESNRMPMAILRRKQVEREVGLSRSSIYQRIKDGTFPAPVKLGLRAVGWRVADIDRFLEDPTGYRSAQSALQNEIDTVAALERGSKPGRGA